MDIGQILNVTIILLIVNWQRICDLPLCMTTSNIFHLFALQKTSVTWGFWQYQLREILLKVKEYKRKFKGSTKDYNELTKILYNKSGILFQWVSSFHTWVWNYLCWSLLKTLNCWYLSISFSNLDFSKPFLFLSLFLFLKSVSFSRTEAFGRWMFYLGLTSPSGVLQR